MYLQDIGIFIPLNEFNEGNCLTETDKDEIIKKNNNIKIHLDCCRIFDFYGYYYYMEKNGEIPNEEE